MSDNYFYKLLKQNPEKALKELMHLYAPLLKTIIMRVLYKHKQDVEECLADVFVALWSNANVIISQKRPIKGWLVLTARNKAIDRYRKLKRQNETDYIDNCISIIMGEDIVQNMHELTASEEIIQDLILKLPFPDKEIFIRKYYFMESGKEIAQELKMSEEAVNTRLSRGRAKLKTAFLNEYNNKED